MPNFFLNDELTSTPAFLISAQVDQFFQLRNLLSMIKSTLIIFFASVLFYCPRVRGNSIQLPAEIPINPEAGRGGPLIVHLRLESGEDLLFMLDTGTSGTTFDKSLESKLGKPLGTTTMKHWGVLTKENVYAMPKLFSGDVPLDVAGRTVTFDLNGHADKSGRRLAGILGYDCLRHYCVQLDFAAGRMRFLDDDHADKSNWGKAFPIVALNEKDSRPAVAENLLGLHGPHSLIDSGYPSDGWLMTNYFQQWTNTSVAVETGQARSPHGKFAGEKYPLVFINRQDVESDGIGLRFLARHLVTLDFPNHTMYLARQSIGPLTNPDFKITQMEALKPLIADVIQEDADAAQKDFAAIEQSDATKFEKTVAQKLAATLSNESKPIPSDAPENVTALSLGDAHAETAAVGWLKPSANRIPLNAEIISPLLDSGKIYATGLFAHAPSRYVFNLGGKWNRLRGEAGLHTTFQNRAFGVVFVIKADGREVFRSPAIRGSDHARYDLNLANVNTLELIVEKAREQNGGNWALWLDPMISR